MSQSINNIDTSCDAHQADNDEGVDNDRHIEEGNFDVLVGVDEDGHNEHDDDLNRSPPSLPLPRQSEQTAREQLIERERQARLERERARLKRQLVRLRALDEEDQAFAAADIARVNSDDSIANTDRSTGLHLDMHASMDTDMNGLELNVRDDPIRSASNIEENDDNFDLDADLIIHTDESDDKSVACTVGGRGGSDHIQNQHQNGEGHDDSQLSSGADQQNINGGVDRAPSPLGFTMERFLQDGVAREHGSASHPVHVHASMLQQGKNEIVVENHDSPLDLEPTTTSREDDTSSGKDSCEHNLREQPLPLMDLRSDILPLVPPSLSLMGPSTGVSLGVGAPIIGNSTSPFSSPCIVGLVDTTSSRSIHPLVTLLDAHAHAHLEPIANSIDVDPQISSVVTRANSVEISENSSRHDSEHIGSQQPRLAQLTEAEILEMTEIDYASVGNMPPRSERDEQHLPDISGMSNAFSDQTHTTILESESAISIDDESSNTRDSIAHESQGQPIYKLLPLDNVASIPNESLLSPTSNTSILAQGSETSLQRSDFSDRKPAARPMIELKDQAWEEKHAVVDIERPNGSDDTYGLPNRIIRPGMIKLPTSKNASTLHRRAQTTPNFTRFVDDFDYCKYNDDAGTGRNSVFSQHDQSHIVNMNGSIVYPNVNVRSEIAFFTDYGTATVESLKSKESEEHFPLLTVENPNLPIRTSRTHTNDLMESVFSSVRSLSTADLEADINDCDKYLASTVLSRAFPDRFLTLIVTLIIEVPVFLMISGGTDRLCSLIGHDRYQLLMAFLPLSSAISGNCGLQASNLAIRAISHLHVTKENYSTWLLHEILVAAVLGLGIGLLIAIIAYFTSNSDLSFACTIGIANFISILSAGLTGTLSPLVFTFIFHRDASKWGGPLETAIQDNVATFVMVIISYHILRWIPPLPQ